MTAQRGSPLSFILSLDQGTTGSAAFIFDREGRVVSSADREITQIYPQPGWVSHDPEEVFQTTLAVAREAISRAGITASQIAAIGIANQRETTVVWERTTGRSVADAIVWQCRRTAPLCEEMRRNGLEPLVRDRTGLVIDAYFSGTKVRWLLDSITDGQRRAEAGDLCAGTIDSWLLYRLTGGQVHATDGSNASRTMLFNINTLSWDNELLGHLKVPEAVLPDVRPSSGVFGETAPDLFGAPIPITGIVGDQQAALFGQACFRPGMAKNTYGTGSFLLMNTGGQRVSSRKGLLTTVAWTLGPGQVEYALEGSVFITGAAVQWLRDGLGIIEKASDTEALAQSVTDTGGVYFVPAFVGLGAPHWDMYARGTMVGLTQSTTRAHVARATLEAIAYQVRDVLEVMQTDTGLDIALLRVDGGGTANSFLMQFQADLLGIPVEYPEVAETTALGAAYLAGIGVGFWNGRDDVTRRWRRARRFEPKMAPETRDELYSGWQRALERARGWAKPS
ncbi:MAG: glycerol kinase GlpK [Dehalococcoidia bacterium]